MVVYGHVSHCPPPVIADRIFWPPPTSVWARFFGAPGKLLRDLCLLRLLLGLRTLLADLAKASGLLIILGSLFSSAGIFVRNSQRRCCP